MKCTDELRMIHIDKLVPYARNARTHSAEQIKQIQASIREFGFINPMLVDKDYNVIAGHGRLMAARAEGIENIPCVMVEHLTEAQKRAYMLADNKLALNAGWDNELLKVELDELRGLDFDVAIAGFEPVDVDLSIFEPSDEPDDDGNKQTTQCPKCGFEWVKQ